MKKFFSKIGKLLKSLLFLRTGLLTYNFVPLLVFEVVFKAVTVFCAIPFLEWIFSRCMDIAGFSYICDSNICEFLCHPASIITIIVLLVLAAMFSLIEISALIFIFENSRRSQKVTMYSILAYSVKTAIRLLIPKNLPLYFYMLVLVPIINVGVTSSFVSGLSVPTAVIESIVNNFVALGVWVAVLVLGVFFAYRWIYCLQYFCLEKDSAIQAYRHSAKLDRHHRILNFISMMSIQLVISLINNLCVWISKNVTEFAYNSLSFEHTISEIFGFAIVVIFFVLYIIVYSLFMPLSCLKVCGLYYSNKQASGESLDEIVIPISKRPDKLTLIEKLKVISKRKIVGIALVVILIFGSCYAGVDHVLNDIIINSQNQSQTKIITSELFFVSPDNKTLLDTAKSTGSDVFLANVYVSSDGVAYCISNNTAAFILETYNFKKNEATYEETKNYTKDLLSSKDAQKVDNYFSELSFVLSYANQIGLPIIVDTCSANAPNSDKIIANIISNSDGAKNVSWCGSNLDSLKIAKSYLGSIPTIYRMNFGRGDFSEIKDYCDAIMTDQSMLTRHQVNKLHNDGFTVIALGDGRVKKAIQDASNYGIDYLFVYSPFSAKSELETNQKIQFVNEASGRYAFIMLFKDML